KWDRQSHLVGFWNPTRWDESYLLYLLIHLKTRLCRQVTRGGRRWLKVCASSSTVPSRSRLGAHIVAQPECRQSTPSWSTASHGKAAGFQSSIRQPGAGRNRKRNPRPARSPASYRNWAPESSATKGKPRGDGARGDSVLDRARIVGYFQ